MKDYFPDFVVRPMTENDLEAILAIECDSFSRPWSRNNFLDELKSDHSFPMVAVDHEGAIIGYIMPMLYLDEGHILDVAVRRDRRGKGIGRRLVERVLLFCRERGASFVALEVRVSNKAAIALYHQAGFVEKGRRRKYYENSEDAILMEYDFTENGVDNAV
ncbi:MAG TPA: ribosomal protein S18-alanine N-acetyltransferase [Geobacteraceae bacterium]|nr:ribosomal protein S18-alanine N-acetyltransferase [Geobacteraceae bacterium]